MSEPPVYATTSSVVKARPSWAFKGINQHPSYHGVITQEEAEQRLSKIRFNCYLTRFNRKNASFMLSVATLQANNRNFMHLIITITNNEYEVKNTGKRFCYISELLEFYLHNFQEDADSKKIQDDDIKTLLRNVYTILYEDTRKTYLDLRSKSEETYAIPTWFIKDIGTHPSFHGVMTGEEAELVLKKHGGNCFLTRFSLNKSRFRPSVMSEEVIQHFSIKIYTTKATQQSITSKFEIVGAELEFDDISELLAYYKNTPLTFQVMGIGQCVTRTDNDKLVRQELFTEMKAALMKTTEQETSITTLDRQLAAVTVPTLSTLTLVKWEDDTGQERKLKITEKLSAEWQRVGILLGLPMSTLEGYRQKTTDPVQRCTDVFHYWLENSSQSDYPPTWKGVYTLLNDIDHGKAAEELKQYLASKHIEL